jgi:hypothetical protein
MASQLLFGELVEIMDKKGRLWTKIRCIQDNFVGWIESTQFKPITPTEFELFSQNFAFSLELVQGAMAHNHFVPITLGARLPNYDGLHFRLGETQFTFSGQAVMQEDARPLAAFILKVAKRYLNTPFLWGGRSPFGIDSAGLIQMVFSIAGIQLPRDSAAQIDLGDTVDFVEQSKPGDLAFFENRAGRITHVGIIMEEGQIIHAYGGVRIDRLDHYGIFSVQEQRYTHRLRLCKRILPPAKDSTASAQKVQISVDNQVELF